MRKTELEPGRMFRFSDNGIMAMLSISNEKKPVFCSAKLCGIANFRNEAMSLSQSNAYAAAYAGLDIGSAALTIASNGGNLPDFIPSIIDDFKGDMVVFPDAGITKDDLADTKHRAAIDSVEETVKCMHECIVTLIPYLNIKSMDYLRISVQGVGAIGKRLCERLLEHNAETIFVADKDEGRSKSIISPKVWLSSPENIYKMTSNIFSPCAENNLLTASRVYELMGSVKAVVGAAHCPATENGIEAMMRRDIQYVPGFIVNSGLLIAAYEQYTKKKHAKQDVLKTLLEEKQLHTVEDLMKFRMR